jgi:hypothetical protein
MSEDHIKSEKRHHRDYSYKSEFLHAIATIALGVLVYIWGSWTRDMFFDGSLGNAMVACLSAIPLLYVGFLFIDMVFEVIGNLLRILNDWL